MSRMSFIKQYIKNPGHVGAILPSSKYLSNKMVAGIDFNNANVIVEYGPGTGVFTDKLIENRNPNTLLVVVENNLKFYKALKIKYKDICNFHLIHGSAENINEYLKQHNIPNVDYVVSGLPFASLPKEVAANILDSTTQILKEKGEFITFQYTLLKKDFINQYFNNIGIEMEIRNIPPAYVFSCSNNGSCKLK